MFIHAIVTGSLLFAAPAQAATTAKAEVAGANGAFVRFIAGPGQTNALVITISGRTVTLDDKVAIKAGPLPGVDRRR
ncbi:hypothetical protein [Actinoplanes sp. G11-F43]|uniref:hypothetical protein n=1 Tax=Actinoplanes sp. G11-F43 TaxID=3424130 RepID=UPI003D32B9D8